MYILTAKEKESNNTFLLAYCKTLNDAFDMANHWLEERQSQKLDDLEDKRVFLECLGIEDVEYIFDCDFITDSTDPKHFF